MLNLRVYIEHAFRLDPSASAPPAPETAEEEEGAGREEEIKDEEQHVAAV